MMPKGVYRMIRFSGSQSKVYWKFTKFAKGTENAGEAFLVFFSWNAFFHLCERVFVEMIDIAANSLYNSY